VTEPMEELACADPTSLLNQFPLHDREMGGGSAETDPAQFPPEPERLPKGRLGFGFQLFVYRSFARHKTL
jgi:hypothetical protein